MNVNVKPRAPFQKRKPSPIAAQATGSAETFVRYVIARAIEQLERKRDAYTIALRQVPRRRALKHRHSRHRRAAGRSFEHARRWRSWALITSRACNPISAAARLFRA